MTYPDLEVLELWFLPIHVSEKSRMYILLESNSTIEVFAYVKLEFRMCRTQE